MGNISTNLPATDSKKASSELKSSEAALHVRALGGRPGIARWEPELVADPRLIDARLRLHAGHNRGDQGVA